MLTVNCSKVRVQYCILTTGYWIRHEKNTSLTSPSSSPIRFSFRIAATYCIALYPGLPSQLFSRFSTATKKGEREGLGARLPIACMYLYYQLYAIIDILAFLYSRTLKGLLVWRSPPLAKNGGSGTDAVLDLSIWNADVKI